MNAVAPLNVSNARLPQAYENAKVALANCASVDECQDWADKAAALASYARQADDQSLLHHAQRIQGRAVRRCGELLKQVDGRGRPTENSGGAPTISQRQMAAEAGLSKDQQVSAVRIANIPAETFEAAVEGEKPPTVTALADMGRQRRATPPPPEPIRPVAADPGFGAATAALGVLNEFAEFCRSHDPLMVAGGVDPSEVSDARADVGVIDAWLDRFIVNMKA